MRKPKTTSPATPREFLWNLASADIAWLRPAEAEFAVDGSSDCGAIRQQPQPKQRAPRQRADRR